LGFDTLGSEVKHCIQLVYQDACLSICLIRDISVFKGLLIARIHSMRGMLFIETFDSQTATDDRVFLLFFFVKELTRGRTANLVEYGGTFISNPIQLVEADRAAENAAASNSLGSYP
jgi:hypothetical protein